MSALGNQNASADQATAEERSAVPDGSTVSPGRALDASSPTSAAPDAQATPDDPFRRLEFNLRTAFATFSEKPSVWKQGYRLDRTVGGDRASAPGSRRASREESGPGMERTRLFRILVVDKVCCSQAVSVASYEYLEVTEHSNPATQIAPAAADNHAASHLTTKSIALSLNPHANDRTLATLAAHPDVPHIPRRDHEPFVDPETRRPRSMRHRPVPPSSRCSDGTGPRSGVGTAQATGRYG